MARNDYFDWLYGRVVSGGVSYRQLLRRLYDTDFQVKIRKDRNRADDGLQLRYTYATENPGGTIVTHRSGSCSVLEMMVALAIRCESIMDDTRYGDRTSQWFWMMINSLGLSSMQDSSYDEDIVDAKIRRFMHRKYAPNGKGGLFTVNDRGDLRKIEIWYQLNWWLDTFIG